MKKVVLTAALALVAVPAHAGVGPSMDRCGWITSQASDNLYNICFFFSTIPFHRFIH